MHKYQLIEEDFTGKKYKPGTDFHCFILIPDTDEECGLYVGHDGRNPGDENALLRLAEEGKAPYCVCIEVDFGYLKLKNSRRLMRLDEYDLFNSEYADLLVYELIPYFIEKYHLNISPSPDLHMIAGGSSGGISSFAIAWFHPEYFHRVHMSSPSFLAMGRGNEIPVLIRKYETKPIKVSEEYSEDEPDDYFGSSLCAAKEAETALKFAGYDLRCRYFPGEGHCSRRCFENDAYERLAWLWDRYGDVPVTPLRNSPRVSVVVPYGSVWEKCGSFPKKSGPALSVISSDKEMRYYGDADDDVIYKTPIDDPDARYCHGMLHTLPQTGPKGALDMAVDENDRLYVLTSIGVQCVRSFGLIDVILELPDKSRPLQMAFGDPDSNMLYLRTENGVYRRELCARGAGDEPTAPKFTEYYD